MLRSAITLITFFLFVVPIRAQTGPGGIGNFTDNGLWLRADVLNLNDGDAVDFWPDESGNVNDAEQSDNSFQPVYTRSSTLNAMPAVRLDGNDDRLIVADADILDGTQAITYFAVINPFNLSGAPRGILGKRTNQGTRDATYAYTWFFFNNDYLNLDVNLQDNRFTTEPVAFENNTSYLLSWDFAGSRAPNVRTRILNGSQVVTTATETSSSLPNSNQPLVLGALNDNYGTYLGADYAEIIHYNRALRPLERLIVNNYLSGKYAIPLVTGDLYTQDNPINGDFDFDIAGIGRISATDQVTQAQGSGLLSVENPTDLDDNEYLLWGNDGQPASLVSTSDLPGTTENRLARTWRLSEVGSGGSAVDVGAVDMAFNLGGLGFSEEEVQLLVDTDNDGNFADETPIAGARLVGAEIFQFDGVTALADGRRFTIGQASASLPIVLLNLSLTEQADGQPLLEWQTISETDNDYFVIERSTPTVDWQEIGTLPGGGTTTTVQRYRFTDTAPVGGRLYYRIRQVDYDGRQAYSQVLSLSISADRTSGMVVFPNPTHGSMRLLHGDAGSEAPVRIFTQAGREVTHYVDLRYEAGAAVDLDLGQLPPGSYLVRHAGAAILVAKE